MKVKTYKEGAINYPPAGGWVRAAMYSQQRKQKSAAAKRQPPCRPSAMQRQRIATNHL
jgi:hypothetical protein